MKKSKLLYLSVISLILTAGMILVACGPNCPGNGECTVTIGQDGNGLYIDNNSPRSTCGKSSTYNYDTSRYSGGCKVQDNIDNRNRKYGTQSCDC